MAKQCCSWLLAACLLGVGLRALSVTFVPGSGNRAASEPGLAVAPTGVEGTAPRAVSEADATSSAEPATWQVLARFFSGVVLGVFVLSAWVSPSRADIEDVAIPVDGKGKTVTLSKEELTRGKRLFNSTCANCHVGGGTRTNQNVGLGFEELSGAQPVRNTVDGLVDYLNNPTTYDGLKDISEVHPSISKADVWRIMQPLSQKDLYDISAYILYQNFTIPEKWGGGKQYY
eukprot:CAMPEP_0171097804 /NCGR_PEP_ID=MMETSP0766_2-20121228/47758_1 /TAXON_ID=439317 /ORGANISM="Gambierdiscus australes, Strain CAWD 149" /LENGTH=229 /DNA_ID=CAMNT_0011557057 /DNA_START=60 /DNA_END=749 /DNA_ORIENTATION=-